MIIINIFINILKFSLKIATFISSILAGLVAGDVYRFVCFDENQQILNDNTMSHDSKMKVLVEIYVKRIFRLIMY